MAKPFHILIVDDDPNMHRLIQLYLNKTNAVVTTASSARVALHKMNSQSFNLMISDLQMPQMDGIELVRTVRAAGRTLPVLIISAFGLQTHAHNALNAGANKVLEKPFERKELLEAIRLLVQNDLDR